MLCRRQTIRRWRLRTAVRLRKPWRKTAR